MTFVRERLRRYLGVEPNSTREAAESFPMDADTLFPEDVGWQASNIDAANLYTELRPMERRRMVERSRLYFTRDAMCQQAVRLTSAYVIGRGVSIKARDITAGEADEAQVKQLQDEADRFWEHPDNSYTFDFESQQRNCDKLSVDGHLFFMLYLPLNDAGEIDANEVTRVRVLDDCLQITKVIKNPEDASEPWYYLRVFRRNNVETKWLYPDYRLFLRDERDENDDLQLPTVPDDPDLQGAIVQRTTFMRSVKINAIGDWGNSMLIAALDWAKVNREYLEDRATISRAHARFAWKRIVKGPASAVAAFGKRAISRIGTGGATSGQPVPPSPAGATVTTNAGVDWEAMNNQDGGKNAYTESRNFRLMVQMATGFPEHYFADGSMGTRATSKSMERPVELVLTLRQTLWKRVYESFFAFHLAAIGREYDAHAVWVDAPQILEDDTATIINSILAVIAVLPSFNVDEIVIRMLNAIGIDDPQDVLVKIREQEKVVYDQELALAIAQAGLDPTFDPNTADPATTAAYLTSMQKIITMLTPGGDTTTAPGPKRAPQFALGQPGASLALRNPSPAKTRQTDPAAETMIRHHLTKFVDSVGRLDAVKRMREAAGSAHVDDSGYDKNPASAAD